MMFISIVIKYTTKVDFLPVMVESWNLIVTIFVDSILAVKYAYSRPGGTGAAEPCEPRQVRKEAAVSGYLWVPSVILPGHFNH